MKYEVMNYDFLSVRLLTMPAYVVKSLSIFDMYKYRECWSDEFPSKEFYI